MKKFILIGLLCAAFLLGYGFSRLTNPVNSGPRVTGPGGIFFKAKDPAAQAWYSKNLGISMTSYGSTFEWHQGMDSTKKGFTAWAPFKETTKYFQPSEKQFMINYRVVGLDQLLAQMKTSIPKAILPCCGKRPRVASFKKLATQLPFKQKTPLIFMKGT